MDVPYVRAIVMALLVSMGTNAYAQSFKGASGNPPAAGSGSLLALRDKDGYTLVDARKDFRLLSLDEAEAVQLSTVIDMGSRELELARAEIRELQARLARQMLDKDPDLDALGKTVRASLELEYQIRMIQIRRNLAIRAMLGDKRWAALSRLSRVFSVIGTEGNLKPLAERAGDVDSLTRLFEILKSLQ